MAWEGLEHPITKTSVRFTPGQRAKYVPNHRSFGSFMRSDQVRDATAEAAKDIATLAAALTGPGAKNEPSKLFEKIQGGFRVKRNSGLIKVGGNLRVKVHVVNNVEGAALAEFGARQIKRRRMLGRAGATFHPGADFKPEGGPT